MGNYAEIRRLAYTERILYTLSTTPRRSLSHLLYPIQRNPFEEVLCYREVFAAARFIGPTTTDMYVCLLPPFYLIANHHRSANLFGVSECHRSSVVDIVEKTGSLAPLRRWCVVEIAPAFHSLIEYRTAFGSRRVVPGCLAAYIYSAQMGGSTSFHVDTEPIWCTYITGIYNKV